MYPTKLGFPDIPPEYIAHFVRGVTDGDGTLAWNGNRPIVHIYSGSREFLPKLALAIEEATGIPAPTIQSNRSNWTIKWSTIRAKCLVAWLYKQHPGLALSRKAMIADDFLGWQAKKHPEKGTITQAMKLYFPAYLPF